MLSAGFVMAQSTGTIYGNVATDEGAPLAGANIIVVGTEHGGTSDGNGFYEINVPPGTYSVRAEYIGYESSTAENIAVAEGKSIQADFSLSTSALAGEEVVVTALGIKQKTKALGFSLTEVKGEELSLIKETNAINSLQGKVAGVNVTSNATGSAGSSRIIIRGNSSLTGNNQPLYVVDGIPISNVNNGSAGMWGGSDGGDGISSINADDIASVSVLKGGAAAALYGARAANGVIIINTRDGRGQSGLGVQFSSSATFDNVDTGLTDYQTEYGHGSKGEKPTTAASALDDNGYAWGAKLDGTSVIQWDGESRPYSSVGNNLSNFYSAGKTIVNSVALTSGSDALNYRFSATELDNEDIMPGAGLNRKSFSLNANAVHSDKITSTINIKYVNEDVTNRPRMSDSPGNGNYTAATLAPSVDVRTMKGLSGTGINEDGKELRISTSSYTTNPYWSAYHFKNNTRRNRFINSATVRYNILEWLYLSGRAGLDHYTIKRTYLTPWGTAYSKNGAMGEQSRRYSQIDADVMLGVERELAAGISTNSFVGASRNFIKQENLTVNGNTFVIPGLENVSNLKNRSGSQSFSEQAVGSLTGSFGLSYNDYVYLTATARKDWFSTLSAPGKESPNNDLYTSYSASFILSEALSLPGMVDFAKLRVAVSNVAGGADSPYKLALAYGIWGSGHQGVSYGGINGGSIPKLDLIAYSKSETEFGLDTRMFGGRLRVDMAYYKNTTTDDIVGVNASNTSGYGSAVANLGKIENSGIEYLIAATPISTRDFSWDVSLNGANNKGIVVATNDVNGNIGLGGPRTRNVQILHIVGKSYGLIHGESFARADDGTIMYDIDSNGIPRPKKGGWKVLGEGVPPLTMGIQNNFRYKSFNVGFLIDGKFGAQIFSGTNTTAYWRGLHKDTLEGRENGLKVSGVDAATGQKGEWTVAPENLATYYGRLSGIAEHFVYDADYLRLSRLRIGYRLPNSLISKTPFQSVNVAFIAKNLFYLKKSVKNIAPEAAYNISNAQGLEYYGVPATTSYGFSLNVNF